MAAEPNEKQPFARQVRGGRKDGRERISDEVQQELVKRRQSAWRSSSSAWAPDSLEQHLRVGSKAPPIVRVRRR